MQIEVKQVTGLKELEQNLKQLDVELQTRAITSSLRLAARKTIIPLAKAAAKRSKNPSSGALAESIAVRAGRKPRMRPHTYVFVGPMTSVKSAISAYNDFYSRRVRGLFHSWFVDQGFTDPAGRKHPGSDFMKRAAHQSFGPFVDEFARALGRRIDRELRKMKK